MVRYRTFQLRCLPRARGEPGPGPRRAAAGHGRGVHAGHAYRYAHGEEHALRGKLVSAEASCGSADRPTGNGPTAERLHVRGVHGQPRRRRTLAVSPPRALQGVRRLVERFAIEPFPDFSAK